MPGTNSNPTASRTMTPRYDDLRLLYGPGEDEPTTTAEAELVRRIEELGERLARVEARVRRLLSAVNE